MQAELLHDLPQDEWNCRILLSLHEHSNGACHELSPAECVEVFLHNSRFDEDSAEDRHLKANPGLKRQSGRLWRARGDSAGIPVSMQDLLAKAP